MWKRGERSSSSSTRRTTPWRTPVSPETLAGLPICSGLKEHTPCNPRSGSCVLVLLVFLAVVSLCSCPFWLSCHCAPVLSVSRVIVLLSLLTVVSLCSCSFCLSCHCAPVLSVSRVIVFMSFLALMSLCSCPFCLSCHCAPVLSGCGVIVLCPFWLSCHCAHVLSTTPGLGLMSLFIYLSTYII